MGKILTSNMDCKRWILSCTQGGSWVWFLVSELYYGRSVFKSWTLFWLSLTTNEEADLTMETTTSH